MAVKWRGCLCAVSILAWPIMTLIMKWQLISGGYSISVSYRWYSGWRRRRIHYYYCGVYYRYWNRRACWLFLYIIKRKSLLWRTVKRLAWLNVCGWEMAAVHFQTHSSAIYCIVAWLILSLSVKWSTTYEIYCACCVIWYARYWWRYDLQIDVPLLWYLRILRWFPVFAILMPGHSSCVSSVHCPFDAYWPVDVSIDIHYSIDTSSLRRDDDGVWCWPFVRDDIVPLFLFSIDDIGLLLCYWPVYFIVCYSFVPFILVHVDYLSSDEKSIVVTMTHSFWSMRLISTCCRDAFWGIHCTVHMTPFVIVFVPSTLMHYCVHFLHSIVSGKFWPSLLCIHSLYTILLYVRYLLLFASLLLCSFWALYVLLMLFIITPALFYTCSDGGTFFLLCFLCDVTWYPLKCGVNLIPVVTATQASRWLV